jgi:adenosylhomocysteine nucleosidase
VGLLTLGWVTGLTAEARLLRGLGLIAVGGGTPEGATAAADRLVQQGARALVSFGLAGGLDPALRPGDVVVPGVVLNAGADFATDPALNASLGGITHARLAVAANVLADIAGKRALFAATGAAAVDLESGAVARVATAHGLPFAVLRAVCDPADAALPPAALAALDGRGAIGFGRVLRSLAAQPGQIAALLALARNAAAARRALRARLVPLRAKPL